MMSPFLGTCIWKGMRMRKLVTVLLAAVLILIAGFNVTGQISAEVDRIVTAVFQERYDEVKDCFLTESLMHRVDYGHGAITKAAKYPLDATEVHSRTYPQVAHWFFGAKATYAYTYDYIGYNETGQKYHTGSYSVPVTLTLQWMNGKWIIVDKHEDP